MRPFGRGSQLGIVVLLAILLFGLAAAFAIAMLWPQALLASIVIACTTVVLVAVITPRIVDRIWVLWFVVPALALIALGTIMLAEDLAVSRDGELTEVVIVDHTLDVETVHDSGGRSRQAYTHEYAMERTDGTPVEEPLLYRGQDGYDFEEGETITVLIDPDGHAPATPAQSVDFGADAGMMIVGLFAVIGANGVCSLLLLKDAIRGRGRRSFGR